MEKDSPEDTAFDQDFKGWIRVASTALSVNRGNWTGLLNTPNFHNFNAVDPTWSMTRDIGIGSLHFDFCRPYRDDPTAARSTAEALVVFSAALLSCQIAEL